MAAVPIRMSSIMLITTFSLNRPLTTLISETIFPCRIFAVIDHPNFRAAIRAERKLVTAKRQRVYGVVAIRALVCSQHSFFFDEAHDACIRLDKICQKLKAIALAENGLDSLETHLIPDWFVQALGGRTGLTETSEFRRDLKTPFQFAAHVKSPFRIRDRISARMNPYLQSRCTPSGVHPIRTLSTRNSHLSCAESE